MTNKLPSKTFCALPWMHLSTRPDGNMRVCCTANASSVGATNDKKHGGQVGVLKTESGAPANLNNSNLDVKRSSNNNFKKGRKFKYQSLLLDKNFEPARNLTLEELTDETCKYMEGHPDEKHSSFCGRKTVQKFSYCPLHLLLIYQVKSKKDELTDEDEIPKFIEKKIKSA